MVDRALIERWASSGYVNGNGNGDGSGDGSGSGTGNGFSNGSGHGNGHGDGSGFSNGSSLGSGSSDGSGHGNGSGDGCHGDSSGIESVNGKPVYVIDGIRTIVASIKGDIARGAILREDLSLKDCFIARSGGFFAHGETAREALADAAAKSLQNEPIDSRIERFLANSFPMRVDELSRWHNILTGSCAFGRAEFIKAKGLKEDQELTLLEFCEIARGEYGREIIKQVEGRI